MVANLSPEDLSVITSALRVAAALYEQDAEKMSRYYQRSVAEQLNLRAIKARELAASLD